MMASLRHRGPDEDGLLSMPRAAIGMRRLSIIDLPGGRQPIFNERGDIAVVFNGEIYNFRQLRRTLESRGHLFRTRSDTEVIVHAYEQWGESCVEELRGMFAFAVWDSCRKGAGRAGSSRASIFLARDRLGIKPLYYTQAGGAFLFASEVRALLASGCVQPRLSNGALEAYLLFGSVAEPSTLVESVYSLPPGHSLMLEADASSAEISPRRYWDLSDSASRTQSRPKNLADAAGRLRTLLEQAVGDHLIADVPLGVFLSSGIDSTALAALASRAAGDLRTFTVVFPEQQFSEAPLARATSQRLGAQHEELLLTPAELLAHLDHAVAALDQPSMDGINTWFVSWAARQAGLKVALSGLGGDEVFGGYATFSTAPRAAMLSAAGRFIPAPLRSLSLRAAALFASNSRADAVQKAASALHSPRAFPHGYFFTRTLFTPARVEMLLSMRGDAAAGARLEARSEWRERLEIIAREARRLDTFACISALELQSYMVNTLLRDTDAVSMAHSLEVRVPLLDHRIVEFVAQLPMSAKWRAGIPKALLIEALRDILPQEVMTQPKRTFTLPWEVWLRGPLGLRVALDLADLAPELRSHLNEKATRRVWQSFVDGRTSWSRPWSLFVLNDWVRRNLSAGTSELGESAQQVPIAAAVGGMSSSTA